MKKVLLVLVVLFALSCLPLSKASTEPVKKQSVEKSEKNVLVVPPVQAEAPTGFVPTIIEIPKLGLISQIEVTGLNSDRIVDTPDHTVGWYQKSAKVKEAGNIVLAGHYMEEGNKPGVFNKLSILNPGDQIILQGANNQKQTYEVLRLENHETSKFPTELVYGKNAEFALRLVTCAGDFLEELKTYSHRTIVFAKEL